jgi:hypothetical protein
MSMGAAQEGSHLGQCLEAGGSREIGVKAGEKHGGEK